jgi:Tol biopolymer transport system component
MIQSNRLLRVQVAGCLSVVALACHESTEPGDERISGLGLAVLEALPYERLGGGTLAFERIASSGSSGGVIIVNLSTRQATKILVQQAISGPALSPDGKQIAYTSLTGFDSFWDLFVANADGSGRTQVTALAGQEHAPAWTTDGSRLLISEQPLNASPPEIYYAFPRATSPARFARFPLCSTVEGRLSVASDGRVLMSGEIADGTTCSNQGIYLITADGAQTTPVILRPRGGDSLTFYYAPAWSPDASRIAYLEIVKDTNFAARRTRVWTSNADGTARTLLATLNAITGINNEWAGDNTHSLAWSPDGKQIAFTNQEGDLVVHIYVVNADGTGLTRVTSADKVTDRSISWVR